MALRRWAAAVCALLTWASVRGQEGSEYKGLRSRVVWDFLDESAKNCRANTLQQRLSRVDSRLGDQVCPEGTTMIPTTAGGQNVRCLEWFPTPAMRTEAANTCRLRGGHLPAPTHPEVETTMLHYVRRYTNAYRWWVGLKIVGKQPDFTVEFDRPNSPTSYWNTQFMASPTATVGQACCPMIDVATGDPTCLVYDGWRELQKLHPYPVTDCGEAIPFFCEVPALSIDEQGRQLVLSVDSPSVLYAPQPEPTAELFNYETSAMETKTCTPSLIFDMSKRHLVHSQLERALRFMASALSPMFPTARLQGNSPRGDIFTCTHTYFQWDLAKQMQRNEEAKTFHFEGLDLLVLVTGNPAKETVTSFPCVYESDGRPTVIMLNVNPQHLDAVARVPKGIDKLYARILHGLLRATGFHNLLFPTWKQPVVTKTLETPQCADPNLQLTALCRRTAVMSTPRVMEFINRVQFRCTGHPDGGTGSLDGAELDDMNRVTGPPGTINAYWEKRLFRGEVLTYQPPLPEDLGVELPVVSGLTLAAFKDMGWYDVQEGLAERLSWGYKRRCDFALQDCGGDSQQRVDRYKCSSSTTLTCSPDFLSLAHCTNISISGTPERFQGRGGSDPLMDYCAFKTPPNSDGFSCLTPEPASCQEGPCATFHVKGASSRCFESTLEYQAYRTLDDEGGAQSYRGTCLPHKCIPVANGDYKLEVLIGGAKYTCQTANEVVGPSVVSATGVLTDAGHRLVGQILCPSPEELCTEAGVHLVEQRCSPTDDCNAHGTCAADGTCTCFDSTRVGHFAGDRCDRCKPGYAPYPHCTELACPRDEATQAVCYGNGACNGVSGTCACYANATHGYWDPATACGSCSAGYSGAMCNVRECKDDSECGRGVCTPVGRCKCFFDSVVGFWTGRACNRCMDGYDIATGCKQRHPTYFACDAVGSSDALVKTPEPVDCSSCSSTCAEEGRFPAQCQLPKTLPLMDQFGCLMAPMAPSCVAPATQTVCLDACPTPSVALVDCKGYPLPYETCGLADACGCLPSARVECLAGTSAALPFSYNPQMKDGATDVNPYTATEGKRCHCHDIDPIEIDCYGKVDAATGLPAYEWGKVVYFDPRRFQEVQEDFCRCTSPPLPTCSQTTSPYRLPDRAYGTPMDCTAMMRRTGCPDWEVILNIGRVARPGEPDLSIIDCGGWPAPTYAAKDPCGCPFPAFTCRVGTEGVCDAGACPVWDETITLDCKGAQPPIPTLRRPHPCGCDPPPKPVCAEGTGACCTCDFPTPPTIWVDCRWGEPMDIPAWTDETVYPDGNPWLQPCNPCPECIPPPPVRKCIPGYAIRPASENYVTECTYSPLDLSRCPVYPPSCPVDCEGAPMPDTVYDDECECPPPPPPACIPGTSGPGSVRELDINIVPCAANPSICGAYACAPDRGLEELAALADVPAGAHRKCSAREEVWSSVLGEKHCKQTCATDLDCACGFKCGICGRCVSILTPDPPTTGNCLLDHGVSCAPYTCELSCAHDIEQIIETGVLFAKCKASCASEWDCSAGHVCDLPLYTAPPAPRAARGGHPQTVGGAGQDMPGRGQERHTTAGLPGFAPFATFTGEGTGVEVRAQPPLERERGECVVSPEGTSDRMALRCFSHDDCDGYACGTDRSQTFFSTSRCRSTCWVDAHCHPDYSCNRDAARCVRNAPRYATGTFCEDRSDLLAPHGGCLGLRSNTTVNCEMDLHRDYGLPAGTTLKSLCPSFCGVCTPGRSGAPISREAAVEHREARALAEACQDDADRKLLSFGDTPTERCAAVIAAVGCGEDLGSLVLGLNPGVLTQDVCPRSCNTCTLPPTPAPINVLPDTWKDVCATDFTAREGGSNETKCTSLFGCCYNAKTNACFTCLSGYERPTDQRELLDHAGTDTRTPSPYCDDKPFEHCAPYTCGGARGAVPGGASMCKTSCESASDCQPLHDCVFPTLDELVAQYNAAAGKVDPVTGAAIPSTAPSRMELMRMQSALGGRCVVRSIPQTRAAPDVEEATHTHWLSVAVGGLSGFQADPTVRRVAIPAFPPPRLLDTTQKGLWAGVEESAGECFPYLAGSSEPLAPGQLRYLVQEANRARAEAAAAAPPTDTAAGDTTPAPTDTTPAPDASPANATGSTLDVNSPSLPACETACYSDAGCVPGFYCVLETRADEALPKQTCQPKRGLGTTCREGRECGTGHCVGGVCCNARCDLPCQTCSDMGICGWGLPFTNPLARCGTCEYCDYVPDLRGELRPASPMACTHVAFGADPSGDCGLAGLCNGEGGCISTQANMGGSRSRDCALGFGGDGCKEALVAYRPAIVSAAGMDTCSETELASMSRSPETGMSTIAQKEMLVRSQATGFTVQSTAHPAERVGNKVDKRPRQWASKVVGVSHHGETGCSKILGPPTHTALEERVHAFSSEAYAPRQFHITGTGSVMNPELRWNPLVHCGYTKEALCTAATGCVWHQGAKQCANVESYTPTHITEARCMAQFYCYDHNRTTEECTALYPRCKVLVPTGDGRQGIDPASMTKPKLEWIELEYDTAVDIETVILHENHGAGSLVAIEVQAAMNGSALLQRSGGAVQRTDPATGAILPNVSPEDLDTEITQAEYCAGFSEYGVSVCVRQLGCDWSYSTRQCVVGTQCATTREQCDIYELRGECFWNPTEQRCMEGSACRAATEGESLEAKMEGYCAQVQGETNCTTGQNGLYCDWTPEATAVCVPWDETNECARYDTPEDCISQERGSSSSRVRLCDWDFLSRTCTEREELFDCKTNFAGQQRGRFECENLRGCLWDLIGGTCVENITANGTAHDCGAWGSHSECMSCVYSGAAPGCNALCAWEVKEVSSCKVRKAGYCSAVSLEECNRLPVCSWLGRTRTELDRVFLEVTGAQRVDDTNTPRIPSPTPARRTTRQLSTALERARVQVAAEAATADEDDAITTAFESGHRGFGTLQSTTFTLRPLHTPGELKVLFGCFLNEKVATDSRLLALKGDDMSSVDYKSYCESHQSKSACMERSVYTSILGDLCQWREDIPQTDNQAVPRPPLPLTEMAMMGSPTNHPPSPFRLRHVVQGFVNLTKKEAGDAPVTTACEAFEEGATMNPNPHPWVRVWERELPRFQLHKRYRETHIDVGVTGTRSKNIRLWFAPTSSQMSQIDAVAIVGRRHDTATCEGYIWGSPLPDGMPANTTVDSGSPWAIPCNGRGACGPTGCVCEGNWYGAACDRCKLGWTGATCGTRVPVGCQQVLWDNPQNHTAAEALQRFNLRDLEVERNWVLDYHHFGEALASPRYVLGADHTHIRVSVGIAMMDVDDPGEGGGECGVSIRLTTGEADSPMEIIYTNPCSFYTGVNVVGLERSELFDHVTATVAWPHSRVVLSATTWAGLSISTPRVALDNIEISTCYYPDRV